MGGARTRTRLGRRSTPGAAGPAFYAGPLAFHPGGDGVVVALQGPAGRPLPAPPQPVTQNLPRLGRAVTNPGGRLDHISHPSQRPQIGREPIHPGSLLEGGHHLGQLVVAQPGPPSRPPGAGQRRPSTPGSTTDTTPTPSPPTRPTPGPPPLDACPAGTCPPPASAAASTPRSHAEDAPAPPSSSSWKHPTSGTPSHHQYLTSRSSISVFPKDL